MSSALYLNHTSQPTMFLMSHLMTTRTRNQTKFRYIFVLHGHIIVFVCVILWILILLIFREIFATYSYKRTIHIYFCSSAYSCEFLIPTSFLQSSSWRWRYSSLSWVLLVALIWRNMSYSPFLNSFIMGKEAETCVCLFMSDWDWQAS